MVLWSISSIFPAHAALSKAAMQEKSRVRGSFFSLPFSAFSGRPFAMRPTVAARSTRNYPDASLEVMVISFGFDWSLRNPNCDYVLAT